MTWTYTNDPEGTPRDAVRFLVGDTTQSTALVEDEEIEYALLVFPTDAGRAPWLAAAHVCDGIAGEFGRQVQQTLGPLSAANQQQFEHYQALAQQFRVLYATQGKGVVTGTLGSVKAAGPVLGGGGPTYLGSSSYPRGGV